MRVNVSDLIGDALDWVVSEAVGVAVVRRTGGMYCEMLLMDVHANTPWSPSTNWNQGGPLIEQYAVTVAPYSPNPKLWIAEPSPDILGSESGPTLLIAAMRAIVSAKLGDEVDVPEVLL